jgi:Glycosyltransferase family 87
VVACAAAVLTVFGALSLLPDDAPRSRVSRAAAVSTALGNHETRVDLARYGPYDRVRVTPVDQDLSRVSFFHGPELLLDVAVDGQGRVRAEIRHPPGVPPRGSRLASSPAVLALLLALFLFATLELPLRRARNADVAALALLVLPQVLLTHRLVQGSVLAAYPLLLYLATRCAIRGLRTTPAPVAPSRPLWEVLLRSQTPAGRRRLMRLLAGATAVAVVLLAVTSTGVSDVGFASLAGGTLLAHGVLPYGHMPSDIVHGDTYPLLDYAVHLPIAALTPVRDGFDDLDGALWMAAAAALLTAGAVGWTMRHRLGRSPWPAVLAWLAFPPVVAAASSGANDLLIAFCVAAALACTVSAVRPVVLLTIGGWIKIVPFALLPIWIARSGDRDRRRSAFVVTTISALVLAWTVVDGGLAGIRATVHGISFQLQRGSLSSVWTIYDLPGPQRIVQATVIVFIAVATWRVGRARGTEIGLERLAALSAACLIGLQISANSWAFEYLVWIYPPVFLALLGPRPDQGRQRIATDAVRRPHPPGRGRA